MTRYNITRNAAGGFIVQVHVGGMEVASSPHFETEAEADAWIIEDGRDTEYIVSKDGY
jgi:hypothetical protein